MKLKGLPNLVGYGATFKWGLDLLWMFEKNLGMWRNNFIFSLDMSRVQDDEVGDGTTSVTVLAAELLRVRAFRYFHLTIVTDFEQ